MRMADWGGEGGRAAESNGAPLAARPRWLHTPASHPAPRPPTWCTNTSCGGGGGVCVRATCAGRGVRGGRGPSAGGGGQVPDAVIAGGAMRSPCPPPPTAALPRRPTSKPSSGMMKPKLVGGEAGAGGGVTTWKALPGCRSQSRPATAPKQVALPPARGAAPHRAPQGGSGARRPRPTPASPGDGVEPFAPPAPGLRRAAEGGRISHGGRGGAVRGVRLGRRGLW